MASTIFMAEPVPMAMRSYSFMGRLLIPFCTQSGLNPEGITSVFPLLMADARRKSSRALV
jgi:hypothetical protein